jgi:hypothetical protein
MKSNANSTRTQTTYKKGERHDITAVSPPLLVWPIDLDRRVVEALSLWCSVYTCRSHPQMQNSHMNKDENKLLKLYPRSSAVSRRFRSCTFRSSPSSVAVRLAARRAFAGIVHTASRTAKS